MALCLRSPKDKLLVAKIALSSAFTCLGHSTDQVERMVTTRLFDLLTYIHVKWSVTVFLYLIIV